MGLIISFMELIPANSVTFELAHIAAQRCTCGGHYHVKSQQQLLANELPIDRVRAVCEACGAERAFYFDIHTFYGDPDAYDRFAATEAALRAGIAAIHAHNWAAAEAHLRRAVDPVEGEPAFGWGHYHLGMVLLAQGRYAEGLTHIEAAIRWIPGEPEFERGRTKGKMMLDEIQHPNSAI